MPASSFQAAGGTKDNSIYLSLGALADVSAASAQARAEREATMSASSLAAEREAQIESMAEYLMWASAEWGEPTDAVRTRAREIIDASVHL